MTGVLGTCLRTDHANTGNGTAAFNTATIGLRRQSLTRRDAGIRLQLLLTIRKRLHASLRRRARNHIAIEHRAIGLRSGCRRPAGDAVLTRRQPCHRHQLGTRTGIAINIQDRLANRLCTGEHIARHRRDGTRDTAIGVADLTQVRAATGIRGVDAAVIIDVDRGVADIDAIEIIAAGAVRRHIDITRAKWEPADRRAATRSTAAADAQIPVVATDKGDQGRRIHRTLIARSRRPAPATTDPRPATVMRRRKAPRRIIHPGPAPRLLPCPMTIAIRHPIRCHIARIPDIAVVG